MARFRARIRIDRHAVNSKTILRRACVNKFLIRSEGVRQKGFVLRNRFFVVIVLHFPADRLGPAVVSFCRFVERYSAFDRDGRLRRYRFLIRAAQADIVAVAGSGIILDYSLIDQAISRIDRAELERESIAETVVGHFDSLRFVDRAVRVHGKLVDFQRACLESMRSDCRCVGYDGIFNHAQVFVEIDGPSNGHRIVGLVRHANLGDRVRVRDELDRIGERRAAGNREEVDFRIRLALVVRIKFGEQFDVAADVRPILDVLVERDHNFPVARDDEGPEDCAILRLQWGRFRIRQYLEHFWDDNRVS